MARSTHWQLVSLSPNSSVAPSVLKNGMHTPSVLTGQRRLSSMPSRLSGPSPHTPLCPLLSGRIRTSAAPGVRMCFLVSESLLMQKPLPGPPSFSFPLLHLEKLHSPYKKTVLRPSPQETTQTPHLDLLLSSWATPTLFCHIIFFLLTLMGVDGA